MCYFGNERKKAIRKSELAKLVGEAQFHGARRIAERHGWCWMGALILLLVASILVLIQNVVRFLDRPTFFVKLSAYNTAIPFPTVVVCPEVRYPDHRQDAFMNELKFPPGANKTRVRGILQQLGAFYSGDVPYEAQDLGALQALLDFNGMDVEASARRLTASCEETLLECRWLGRTVACTELFRMEVTGDGFCCVFNGRSLRRELLSDRIYHAKKDNHIWLPAQFEPPNGLVAVLNESQKHDSLDLSYKWVALQYGQRYVDIRMNGTALSPGSEHWFRYTTIKLQDLDAGLKDLRLEMRRCRLQHDEPLLFFPVYSRSYCNVECEMFHTYHQCGCILPTHPRPRGWRYCRAVDLACTRHAKVAFSTPLCSCPMTCDVDMSRVKVDSYELIPNSTSFDPIYRNGNFDRISIIRVYVDGSKRKSFGQKLIFTELDLYSQLGGIFNIYFGCSILTLLEIAMILFRGLSGRYRQLDKQKPNEEPEITKFGSNFIKPTPSRTIYRHGILISFEQTQPKVAAKKSNIKKKNKVGFSF